MMKNILLMVLLLTYGGLIAQKNRSMEGEYYLQGVMETASGFKLNADFTFEFFFSYGALDRYGSGTWRILNNMIVFNSSPQPARDFALVKSEKRQNTFITIQITDNNEVLMRYVDVVLKSGKKEISKTTNDQGFIEVPETHIDSISLRFQLCPDRYSTFAVANREDNYFQFRFEPWISEVFFTEFRLKSENNRLIGKHPLLQGSIFNYTRKN